MFYLTGLLIYVFYGIHHSIENDQQQTSKVEKEKHEQKISK